MKRLLVGIPAIFIYYLAFAQGEIDDQDKVFYRNERTYAGYLCSNGFGGNYRFVKRITAFKATSYEVDLVSIKHPKEVKISTSPSSFTSKSFVYGKLINFYNLRAGIGYQKELFQKFDRGGISIRYFYNFGAALGIKKPIYYNIYIISAAGDKIIDEITEKFDINQHVDPRLMSRASYFKGFNELSFTPGIYGKTGLTFEFSKYDEVIHAIEAGIILDTFIKKISIMAIENDSRVFFSLYLSYRFGKVVDAKFKARKTEIDGLLVD